MVFCDSRLIGLRQGWKVILAWAQASTKGSRKWSWEVEWAFHLQEVILNVAKVIWTKWDRDSASSACTGRKAGLAIYCQVSAPPTWTDWYGSTRDSRAGSNHWANHNQSRESHVFMFNFPEPACRVYLYSGLCSNVLFIIRTFLTSYLQ